MTPESEQRAAVVKEAMTWIGTPYHHHGRIKGAGVDCAMLLCEVFEACGLVQHVDAGFYAVDWHLHHSEEMFSDWLAKYAKPGTGLPKIGDVMLFKFGRTFSHGSIYVGADTLIHSYIGRGVILSRTDEDPLAGRDAQHWSFW